MIRGFSIMEVLVTLALSCLLVTIVAGNISSSSRYSKKITHQQQKMESIFHTIDSIRSDLTKCGMRVQRAAAVYGFPMFVYTKESFKVLYGIADDALNCDCLKGGREIHVERYAPHSEREKILIFDPLDKSSEFNQVKSVEGNRLELVLDLKNEYSRNSLVIVIKEVEYKIYWKQKALKRKVNRGYFQPMMENVTDFNIQYFPEAASVLYRIEISGREQIRGYIFLTNMVEGVME
ncbi:MAG: type II secretion system protein [bacterium]|nr:type II secretion system protein [bacterium]